MFSYTDNVTKTSTASDMERSSIDERQEVINIIGRFEEIFHNHWHIYIYKIDNISIITGIYILNRQDFGEGLLWDLKSP